jgi:hypothetical protein
MTSTLPLWFSGASLIVSAAAFGLSAVVAVRNSRLGRAQVKTELLTKIYAVRIDYSQFNRRIFALKVNPPEPLPAEVKSLLDEEAQFKTFEADTDRYCRTLLQPGGNLDARSLLTLRHQVDALAAQIADDNKRLDEILDRTSKVEGLEANEHGVPFRGDGAL